MLRQPEHREPVPSVLGRTATFTPDLTRAAKTRLGRYGFSDVMHEGMAGGVVLPAEQKDVVVSRRGDEGVSWRRLAGPLTCCRGYDVLQSLELELMDELSRHEITLQFAAFRIVRAEEKPFMPETVYFTYQFYKYPPTKTERVLLREDGLGDRLTSILIRESQFGRDAPAKAYKYAVDTGGLQEGTASL